MATAFMGSDDLWRECAAWLTRFEMLRPDHRANLESATLTDLAMTLRDGVLLCNLLNKIDPGCIDSKDINHKPQNAQFLCSRNTELFLKTCRNNFGLQQNELFEHPMLFHFFNFHQVLSTLSALSRCAKAQKHGIEGFTAQVEKTDDEVYQSLKSVNNTPHIEEPLDSNHNSHHDEIYQGLCGLRTHLDKQQSITLEKRDYVINELIMTERNYLDVLKKIKVYYVDKLKSVLDPLDHEKIFYKILEIYAVHSELHIELDRLNQRHPRMRLSSIILNFKEKFLIYGDFCANLSDATTLLQDLCDRNESICQQIDRADKEANQGKFKLRDLLQVPMQRILKYHLLLENLVKETDPNHEEYNELKRAREAMLDVASYINEMARDKQHIQLLYTISRNIVWDANSQFAMETCGRLKKDGDVRVKMHGEPKLKQRYVFIFDKYMILTKQRNNSYVFRTKLDLAEFSVDEANNRALLQQGVRWSYQWHMVKNDKQVVYSMSVKNSEIRDELIKAIKEAIDNVHPAALAATNHQFEMQTYPEPTTCYKCSKYLKGQIYQGYKCRVPSCSISVHKDCIAYSGRCGAPMRTLAPLPSQEALTLQNKLWFAGEKDRSQAVSLLENRKPGTFLVRLRLQQDTDLYALSLQTDNGVKHMKICSNTAENKYYLSVSRFFNSLEDMVRNYQQASLKENFERLEADAKLEYPYRQIKAEAAQTYSSPSISFERGDTVVIIDKDEEGGGRWYKGISRNGIGTFPSSCVVEQEEITYDAF